MKFNPEKENWMRNIFIDPFTGMMHYWFGDEE
jgi:hypothetical protein